MTNWRLRVDRNCPQGQKYLSLKQGSRWRDFHAWGMVPIVTHEGGYYLSSQDWSSLDFSIVSFNLPRLLIKPGETLLDNYTSLVPLTSAIAVNVLNTLILSDMPCSKKSGLCHFLSPFDGTRIDYDEENTSAWLEQLEPDICVSGELNCINKFPSLLPIQHLTDKELLTASMGFIYQVKPESDSCLQLVSNSCDKYPDKLHYVMGDLNLYQSLNFLIHGADLIETIRPGLDAIDGILYRQGPAIQLVDSQYEKDYQPIEASCSCYTCQHFTRAYLHHLHIQTPLLSKRLQVVHNLYYMKDMMERLAKFIQHGKLREFINTYMM